MSRIGILGGAFDPIHLGHTRIIKESILKLNLDTLLVIPTKNNPWKDHSALSNNDRINTISLAIKDIAKAKICTIELDSLTEDKNYTIDTLKTLKKQYQNDELFYIMGMDQASKFNQWKNAKEISELVSLVVFKRPDYQENNNLKTYHFFEIETSISHESSTAIKQGHIEMLDKNVLSYLANHGLCLDSLIKQKMSNKRYLHTLSVAKLAREFAQSNHLDDLKAYIAAMMHDVAKEMDKDLELELMKKYYSEFLNKPEPVYHQWLSSYVCQNEFDIHDQEILQAIENHTTASLDMHLLDMCVYCADKLDPLRGYDSSEAIALCNQDIKKGFVYCLNDFYQFSKKKNREIEPCFFEIFNKFKKEI